MQVLKFCPECQVLGLKSRVNIGLSSMTCANILTFIGEDGVHHRHDPNTRTTRYGCTNGHTWKEERKQPCPACKWPEKEEDPKCEDYLMVPPEPKPKIIMESGSRTDTLQDQINELRAELKKLKTDIGID